MDDITNYFSVSQRKIEGTEKDYELITSLNPCFQILTKDELSQVQYLVDNVVADIKTILKHREIQKEGKE